MSHTPSSHRRTRGKSRPGRLTWLDDLLPLLVPELATGPGAVVDLGLGAQAWTTIELGDSLAALNPALTLIGADLDPERVATAAAAAPDRRWLCCGFDLPIQARLIRAVNLLRQYPVEQVTDAHLRLSRGLVAGGVALVGTTDKTGSRAGLHLLRQTPTGLAREALVLMRDCSQGFAPLALRDHLPRDLRRRVRPGEPIYAFFQDWTRAWEAVRTPDPRVSFASSVVALQDVRPGVRLLAPGALIWQPTGGIPD
jgi:hypothetical protein